MLDPVYQLITEGKWQEAKTQLLDRYKTNQSDPVLLTNLGGIHLSTGALDEAASFYRLALKQTTVTDNALLGLVTVHLAQNDPTAAEKILKKHESRFPSSIALLTAHGDISFKKRNLEAARKWYETALQKSDKETDAARGLARILAAEGDLNGALDLLTMVVTNDPLDFKAWSEKGLVLMEKKQYDKALNSLETAFKLNPTSVIIQHNLGLLFEKQGQLDVAEKRYKELLNSNPSFLLAKYNLALIYYHRGDFLTATQAFSEILTAHPDFHFATYYQGLTLMKLGKLSEAYALLRKLLRAVPDFAPLYNDLGHIAALLHKKSQARRYFEQCRELDTTLHLPLYNLALLDFGEGKTKSALEALQTITERFPQFVEAHCDLGLIRYQQGAPINLVLENYQQALQIDPKHSRTLFNMGLLYDESDDVKSAITWYENCLATQPTHLECLNNLSLLYCSTGQFDKARDYALRALEVNKGYEPARFNLALALYRNGHGGDALALFEEVATNLGQTGQNPELLQQSLKIINILRQELKR